MNGDKAMHGPSPKSLKAWQRSVGTASIAQLTGHCLAASGIWEDMRLRCFPADSLLRTTSLIVSRWPLEGLRPRWAQEYIA